MGGKIPEDTLKKLDGVKDLSLAAENMLMAKGATQNREQFDTLYDLICDGNYPQDIQMQYDDCRSSPKIDVTGKTPATVHMAPHRIVTYTNYI
jgi:hypothetical protein